MTAMCRREVMTVELTVLTVPGCPNGPALLEALAEVRAKIPGAQLVSHVVQDEAEAIRLGMHGSPTLLIDGTDPFAAPGTPASVSCRIYRDETGQARGAPPIEALALALRQAAASSADSGDA